MKVMKKIKEESGGAMIARVRNIITGEVVDVRSTTEHPDSSYGNPVWVDADNVAYGQVDLPMPLYEVMDVEVYDRADGRL